MMDVAGHPRRPPDGSSQHQHKRVETPEERQRRKEKEHKKEQQKREQEKAAQAARARGAVPGHPPNHPANRLNRETPFLCHIGFRNDLPEIPCDPRMLVAPLQADKLVQFALTTLEQNPRRELVVDPDSAIPVSMLDVERYSVPDMRPPLAPEDAALLQADARQAVEGSRSLSKPVRERAANSELSWLMRTSYISNEVDARSKQTGIGEKRAKAIREADNVVAADDHEAMLAGIEATFDAAAQPPVHLTNPSLTPVEILPVFPDTDRWGNNYVLIAFDNEPTEDIERLNGFTPAQRRALTGKSVVKSYSVGSDRFVAFMVPGKDNARQDEAGPSERSEDGESMEGPYDWVREYSYQVQQEEAHERRTYIFRFEPGAAVYTHISAKLTLSKRGKLIKGEGASTLDFSRPSAVTLSKRPADASEQEMSAKRMRELVGDEDEGSPTLVREAPSQAKSTPATTERGGDWGSSSPSLSD